ncbi:phosphomannomutase/phosphoglucomutase [Candidatus Saccharibacteria bacterium]|nr:phosphomannomutase/phosphoglucomutase [Candidatus Saccharibacteria bacterium]
MQHIFKSYDIRGKVGSELTPDFTHTIGAVFGDWLPTEGVVAVGHDMRPDSAELAQAFIKGLTEQGRDVWDIGLVTSDMIYFAVGKWDLAGGAVITASHNAGDENGIKLYRDKVTPVGLDSGLAEIRDRALLNDIKTSDKTGTVEDKDVSDEWVNHCLSFIQELKPFNIAIDAGNGMAGKILPLILPKLPIHAEQLYFELDGTFPNHEANPQKIENLKDLISSVSKNNFDFGIAFDGDGDRAVFVDDKGRLVLGTDLMTIVAKLYLDKYPGSKIVHDVRTSKATRELIEKWGGVPIRTKAGRVNVGALLREVGGSFGGETTGHFFYKENYEADSGLIVALTAMQAITNSGKKLSELVDEYRLYEMIPEKNFETAKDKEEVFLALKQIFSDGEFDMLDGLTVTYPDFWFNLRSSNTEPVVRLNAEADSVTKLEEVVKKVTAIIQ